jgi:hypothetical protein
MRGRASAAARQSIDRGCDLALVYCSHLTGEEGESVRRLLAERGRTKHVYHEKTP